jgi:hypothetical protein
MEERNLEVMEASRLVADGLMRREQGANPDASPMRDSSDSNRAIASFNSSSHRDH